MASGGVRNRGGRRLDPASGRSERRGVKLSELPPAGFDGDVPRFPLPPRQVLRWESEGKHRYQVVDGDETARIVDRELELWAWAWRTPQACAWSQLSEAWRLPMIAMWVRTYVVCESSSATAADKNSLHRFADQIGMTPAGLLENRWAIAAEAAPAAVEQPEPTERASSRERVRRLRAVPVVAAND